MVKVLRSSGSKSAAPPRRTTLAGLALAAEGGPITGILIGLGDGG